MNHSSLGYLFDEEVYEYKRIVILFVRAVLSPVFIQIFV